MSRRLVIAVVLATMLVAAMAAPVMADETSTMDATVSVSTYISSSIVDNGGSTGIGFEDTDPGQETPDDYQDATNSAVTVTVAAETNVDCNINVKADADFTGTGGTIALEQAKWDTDSDSSGATAMSDTYDLVGTSTASAATTIDIWHWLDVPTNQAPGSYSTTFTYQVTAQ